MELFFSKEGPHERIHFHDLLTRDLLIEPVGNTNGQEEPGTADCSNYTEEVGGNTQYPDKYTADNRHTWDIPVKVFFKVLEDFCDSPV